MKYKIISFIVIALFIFGLFMNIYINTDSNFSGIKNKIIRLHVVANSDSPDDQEIKLKVRDAVVSELSPAIKDLTDVNKVNAFITDNLDTIKKTAQKELEKLDKRFPIEIELGKYEFPTKVYGDFTFPGGEYQALNIKIGNGQGKNWWCVMFPPLCFVDIAQGVVSKNTIDELKEVLTEEEIEMLKSNRQEEIPVKLKFKIAEIYKMLNIKVAKIIRKNTEM